MQRYYYFIHKRLIGRDGCLWKRLQQQAIDCTTSIINSLPGIIAASKVLKCYAELVNNSCGHVSLNGKKIAESNSEKVIDHLP